MPNQTNTNTSGGDIISAGSGQVATARLDSGRVYTGFISETYHSDNLYTVRVEGANNVSVSCRWAAGIFSPMVGIKVNYYPPLGSRVSFIAGNDGANFIISSLPSERYDAASGTSKTMLGGSNSTKPYEITGTGLALNNVKPADLLEGEFEITNTFGSAIQLLTCFARLVGSERAKVEASLLDDMVRIVSDTFKHFSSFGDFQIYNDGRLNCRWDGTSYEHEAWGLFKPTDPKATVDARKIDFSTAPDAMYATGRWRFSHFVGFLGNFIHTFISDPTTTLSNIAEDAFRAGKARVHINNDGSMLMQSVSEIALERVCRISVPVEKKRQDDPEGNKADQFEQLEKDYLRIWDYGQNMSNAHHTAYQLRQYARWLSCYHGYARFLQLDKEWDIIKETESPTPSWFNGEADVAAVNEGKTESYDVYATIRIMRDGSIVLWDAYGSAISMVNGNLQLCATRHVEIDAAGDIRMNAGQSIYLKARSSIEITSIVGGLTLKSRTWLKALCEWGSIWIKSDAEDPAKEGYIPKAPLDPTQDPTPEVLAAAVYIEASQGQMLLQSERRATVNVIGNADSPDDVTDTSASIMLQSRQQDIRVIGARHTILKVLGLYDSKIILDAERGTAIVMKSIKTLIKAFLFDINSRFTLKNSILHLTEVRSRRAHFSTIVSGPVNKGVDIALKPPFCSHGNHMINYNAANSPIELGGETQARDDYKTEDIPDVNPHKDAGEPPDGPDWAFIPQEETYKVNSEDEEVFQPLSQQRLDFDAGFATNYNDWDWNEYNKLQNGKRTNTSSLPFPGSYAKEKVHTGGQPLNTPLDELYKDQGPDKATDLKDENINRKYLKY